MAKHSPLPWRLAPGDNPPDFSRTVDARGCFVFGDNSGPKKADADLIIDAVNAFDRVTAKEKAVNEEINGLRLENNRMRHMLKKLADMYMDHTVWRLSRDEQALIDEARNAIGEEAARDH